MSMIKFRGQKVDNKEWVYGYYFIDERDIEDGFIWRDIPQIQERYGDHYKYHDVIPETVGQYIEKVNDIEVFTSDIIKAYKHGDTETEPFIHQITYRNGTYWFGNWSWIEFLNIFRCVEVIGNIHDNPELLEVQTNE